MRPAKLFLRQNVEHRRKEANEPVGFIHRYILHVWVSYCTVLCLIHEVVTTKPVLRSVLRLLFEVQRFAMENLRCVPEYCKYSNIVI